MLNLIKPAIIGLSTLLLVACQYNNPDLGTPKWQEWVESVVHVIDADGHGPDVGSSEWCGAVEWKLFKATSNLEPCSNEWNVKVDKAIKG